MERTRVLAVLRRRRLLLIVMPLLGLIFSTAAALTRTSEYRSTATVFFSLQRGVSVSEIAQGSDYTQDLVPSYAKVVTMPVVLNPVIADLGLDTTATDLAKHVQVITEQDSVILQIQVTDTSAERTAQVADAIAAQLSSTAPTLSPQTGSDQAGISVTTISPATTPRSPLSTNPVITLAAGLIGGTALALAVIVLLEVTTSSPVRDREAAARLTTAPVLGMIVDDPRARQRPMPISTHPYLARAEGIRLLLTNLHFLNKDAGPQCLTISSAGPGEGRTSTAVNLAIGMTYTGRRVLIIDADLRHPGGVCDLLGLDGKLGLSTVLAGEAKVEEMIQTWTPQLPDTEPLSVLPSGRITPNPSELLSSERMSELLRDLRATYDVVILDSSALLPVTDGALLAALTDGALFVIDSQRTGARQVSAALNLLTMAGAKTLGLVLNRIPEDRHQYGSTRATPLLPVLRPGRHKAPAPEPAATSAPEPAPEPTT